jgi:hypothetical protein
MMVLVRSLFLIGIVIIIVINIIVVVDTCTSRLNLFSHIDLHVLFY